MTCKLTALITRVLERWEGTRPRLVKKAAHAWARRMCRLLKKPNGSYRVLHAAALRARRRLSKTREKEYCRAYNYIRRRTTFMQYATYKAAPQSCDVV